MVPTRRQTLLPKSRIDQVFEDHHYEVAQDNWRLRSSRLHMPQRRLIEQQIRDARSPD